MSSEHSLIKYKTICVLRIALFRKCRASLEVEGKHFEAVQWSKGSWTSVDGIVTRL